MFTTILRTIYFKIVVLDSGQRPQCVKISRHPEDRKHMSVIMTSSVGWQVLSRWLAVHCSDQRVSAMNIVPRALALAGASTVLMLELLSADVVGGRLLYKSSGRAACVSVCV